MYVNAYTQFLLHKTFDNKHIHAHVNIQKNLKSHSVEKNNNNNILIFMQVN